MENGKCEAFEVLGSWLSRLIMWQLGLGENLFVGDDAPESDAKIVMWRTGRRILYEPPVKDSGHALQEDDGVAGTFSELDQWVAEEGIFLHADDYRIDEIA